MTSSTPFTFCGHMRAKPINAEQQRRLRTAVRRYERVTEAERVRRDEVIRALVAEGVGYRSIAHAAGWKSPQSVVRIVEARDGD